MGRPENGVGGKIGEKTKGLGLSPEAIAKLRQVQDFPKFRLGHNLFAATVKTCSNQLFSVLELKIGNFLARNLAFQTICE